MGFWEDRLLPHVINVACGSKDIQPLRERACAGLQGTVLELGFGSGLNCGLYPEAVTSVLAIEPADRAWSMAAKRRAESAAPISRAGLDGQRLDLADDSVDSALITFTLCTIPDAETALHEVARVLKPGGTIHIAEHGASPDPTVARWQRRLDPAQQRVFGGCHLTRDPLLMLTSAGYVDVDIQTGYVNELGPAVGFPTYARRMSDQAHVALLRGINVGGRNAVPMKELVRCVSAGDYADVATYIQSGNVLFSTSQSDARAIELDLEQRIERYFGFPVPVVVRSRAELDATVESAPTGFGGPDHRCDVIFLKHPLTADDAFDALPAPVEGVDQSWKGPAGCLYFSRLSEKASKSRLSRITSSPIYPSITIRNWNTTTKLQRLLAETSPAS